MSWKILEIQFSGMENYNVYTIWDVEKSKKH